MTTELENDRNIDAYKLFVSGIHRQLEKIYEGGGKKKLDNERAKGKMTARERLAHLFDADTEQIEIGAFAGYEMYPEHGGCPAGGVVVIIGYVSGRQCIVVANDATVKAGAWFPITGKKNLRAQEIALENRLPIIYLVDSAGIFLPMQDEIFADKEHFGRIFRNNAKLSAMGVPQIAAIMGSCVAGGAYLPIMSDEALIVDGQGTVFLAGPYLVKAAIGEDIDAEKLGGAKTHSEISGVTDYKLPDDASCLDAVKKLISHFGTFQTAGLNRVKPQLPKLNQTEIYSVFPAENPGKPYNMVEILRRLVDDSDLQFYKEDYGKTIICAYARIDGWSVGIVANQRLIVKNGKNEMQLGGVIYSDSADKATRFILNCNQKKIPLVFFHDVTGFMVGSRSEHGGIIKDGAKMVNAVANSTVPKFTVIIGNSYGAGNYAMCGKAYDPRLIFAWPTAKIAVMGGAQAAKVLLQIQTSSMKTKGQTVDAKDEQKMYEDIKARYDHQTTPQYAAARLWIDAIIDPLHTRRWISMGLEAANNAPIEKFNVGVIQV